MGDTHQRMVSPLRERGIMGNVVLAVPGKIAGLVLRVGVKLTSVVSAAVPEL